MKNRLHPLSAHPSFAHPLHRWHMARVIEGRQKPAFIGLFQAAHPLHHQRRDIAPPHPPFKGWCMCRAG